jgi:hypothetical protein
MAHFKGTIAEFNRYIGPRVRNLVQNDTRKYKKTVGACENSSCQSKEKLEFAHLIGKERPVLIGQVLESFVNNGVVEIDLEVFEERLKRMHFPLKDTGLVLCNSCHGKYDKKQLTF